MEAKDRVKQLRLHLNQHNINYYVYDNPTISDFEYDKLLRELQSLENENPELFSADSPTERIGSSILSGFKTITHRLPMQSLANAMDVSELKIFNKQIKKILKVDKKIEYIAEPKLDGLAVELVYENGLFVYGSTRGDGIIGEDITHNLKTIKSIPLSIIDENPPSLLEVRGEVFINKDDFKLLNNERIKNNESIFANPRNCAAGSLRQLNPKITMRRPLRIFCYAPGEINGIKFNSQVEFLNQLPKWGFPVNPFIKIGKGLSFLEAYYKEAEDLRLNINYDIDGVVFKVNSYELQSALGIRSKSPRWAIAGKLKAEQATSIVEDIIISVGRTGALTPVAKLKPVNIGGVVVSNATLHNQHEVDRKDVRVKDTVLVQRAGDVIPEIIKVIKEKRLINSKPFIIPNSCPVCGGTARKYLDEAMIRCINQSCSAKLKGSIEHFVSKNCMNIEGLGTKITELLIDKKIIKNIADIYVIKHEDISTLDGMGEKSAENIIDSINQSKKTTMSRFIYGLGIRHVGQNSSKILENKFKGDLTKLFNADRDQLLLIHDVGSVMADSIINYFNNDDNVDIINKCLKNGVEFKNTKNIIHSSISGKIFVFTGNLGNLSRSDAVEMIELYGAKKTSSISSKTDYIVVGQNAGSKLKKAKDLGIKILNLMEFEELIKSIN